MTGLRMLAFSVCEGSDTEDGWPLTKRRSDQIFLHNWPSMSRHILTLEFLSLSADGKRDVRTLS